jgi:hypothetical protein
VAHRALRHGIRQAAAICGKTLRLPNFHLRLFHPKRLFPQRWTPRSRFNFAQLAQPIRPSMPGCNRSHRVTCAGSLADAPLQYLREQGLVRCLLILHSHTRSNRMPSPPFGALNRRDAFPILKIEAGSSFRDPTSQRKRGECPPPRGPVRLRMRGGPLVCRYHAVWRRWPISQSTVLPDGVVR